MCPNLSDYTLCEECGKNTPCAVCKEKRRIKFHFLLLLPVMASSALRDELTCCICLSIYTDPVALPCGHSFCRLCIEDVLDTQEGSGAYKCPECRAEVQERPALEKNKKLCNIVETFRSSQLEQEDEEVPVLCTYCDSPVPAAKTCLLCEASLCENHLKKHSKSAQHILTEPTTSLENSKCPIHEKILEYYCCEDATCICVSCSLAGEHRGHQVETLNEAFEKKKEKLRNILENLISKREETEKRVQSLQELKRQVRGKTDRLTEQVADLIRDIKEQLEALERGVLSEISRQAEQVSLQVSDLIQQLEIEKEELSRKMGHIKALCNMTNPLTVLQGPESDRADYRDVKEFDNEDTERHDMRVHDVEDLDVGLISVTLHSGLARIVTGATRQCHVPESSDMPLNVNTASDMLLDINTAGNTIIISGDLKTATGMKKAQGHPKTPERFDCNQVLSCGGFSSGQHYWKVEGSKLGVWLVGIAYHSIDREGDYSRIGNNNKSWNLLKGNNHRYSVKHNGVTIQLPYSASCRRLGIFLDYEAGRLSFYELCDPVRHIHTFTATFTEPLHAVFGIGAKAWVRINEPE
uniref:Uncharacterized protein n=1 Tax=Leptobrachium leishanense TaxID=445787 RepID=A0A8C5QAS9_9ANUR